MVQRLCSLLLFIFSLFLFTIPLQAEGSINVDQDFSVRFGLLKGEGEDYLRYESGPVPGLSPSISLATSLLATINVAEDLKVSVEARDVDGFQGSLGLFFKEWGGRLGSQRLRIAKEGLSLNRDLEGIRLYYQEEDKGLDLFASRSQSRYNEVFLEGNDTMGPYFLGHRNIIENSETVYLDGREQKRGQGPLQEDYYVDYQGGFLFFNSVILSHQEIQVTYEYQVDEGYLSSTFMGVMAKYPLEEAQGEAFLLWDAMPLEDDSILQETGYTRLGWGLSLDYEEEDLFFVSTLLGTEYSGYRSGTKSRTDTFLFQDEVLTYELKRSPILYESERVFVAEEELVRNLDYSMNYHEGELTFFYAFEEGDTIKVEYSSIEEEIDIVEDVQGLRSISRFRYQGEQFNHTSYLSLAQDEYLSFLTHQPTQETISFNTRNHYSFNQDWRLGGDLSFIEKEDRKTYHPSLSLSFDGEDLFSRLRLSSRIDEEEGDLHYQNTLEGELSYETFSTVGFSFKKDLEEEEWIPKEYRFSLSGDLGFLPYSLSYGHGDGNYQERIDSRITLPFTWPGTRGSLVLGNSLLYRDSFSDYPRIVSSLSGRVNFIDLDLFYLNTRTALSHVQDDRSQTSTYDFNGEIGRDLLDNTLLNYGVNIRGDRSITEGEMVRERLNTTHTITLASLLMEGLNLSLSLMRQDGITYRRDRDLVDLLEHRLDLALHHSFEEFHSNIRMNYSHSTTTTGDETTKKSTLEARGEMDYRSEDIISVKGSLGYSLFDRERERYSVRLRPYQPLSEILQLFAQYSYVRMVDRVEKEDLYEAHTLQLGFSFRL